MSFIQKGEVISPSVRFPGTRMVCDPGGEKERGSCSGYREVSELNDSRLSGHLESNGGGQLYIIKSTGL